MTEVEIYNGFSIPGHLVFRKMALAEAFPAGEPQYHELNAESAILKFLAVYPMIPVQTNQQPSAQKNSGCRSGTIVLPLWLQTSDLHPDSEHWGVFTELVESLRPYLFAAEIFFKKFFEDEYGGAIRYYEELQERAGPGRGFVAQDGYRSCFSSLRLSSNLARDPRVLTTGFGRRAEWVVVTVFGSFVDGEAKLQMVGIEEDTGGKTSEGSGERGVEGKKAFVGKVGEPQEREESIGQRIKQRSQRKARTEVDLAPTDMLTVRIGHKLGNHEFYGERIQLELFIARVGSLG
ncbi:hypothetical protein PZA11_007313 [Diplocarpon coronariae]